MLNAVSNLPVNHPGADANEIITPEPSSYWTILPDELIHKILKYLPLGDLASCQVLDQRTVRVVRDRLMLPSAYWQKHLPREEAYSVERYKNDFRPWLLKIGRDDQVTWLDSLQAHCAFSKALFLAVSKTYGQASKWHVKENDAFKTECPHSLLGISPDGMTAVLCEQHHIRVLTLATTGWKEGFCLVRKRDDIGLPTYSCRFGGRSLAIHSCLPELYIMDWEEGQWTLKLHFQPKGVSCYYLGAVQFSSDDSHLLQASESGLMYIFERSGDGWVFKKFFDNKAWIHSALWLSGNCRIVVSDTHWPRITVLNVQGDRLVNEFSKEHAAVHGVPTLIECGDGLMLGAHVEFSAISVVGNEWKEGSMLPGYITTAALSPDGKYFVTLRDENYLLIHFFNGNSWIEINRLNYERDENAGCIDTIVFSPDSTKLCAFPYGGSSIFMELTEGRWQSSACDHAVRTYREHVAFACFSPDGQLLVRYMGSEFGSKIHTLQFMRFIDRQWVMLFTQDSETDAVVRVLRFTADGRKVIVFIRENHSGRQKVRELRLFDIIPSPQSINECGGDDTSLPREKRQKITP